MGIFFGGGTSGGRAPVSCVLTQEAGFSVRTEADHPITWDALYNNATDFTPLAAIPSGLGLTFLHNGTSANLTTTVAGYWSFTYSLTLAADATYVGVLDSRFGALTIPVTSGHIGQLLTTVTLAIPTATTFGPQITTLTAATTDPYTCSTAQLIVTRLG